MRKPKEEKSFWKRLQNFLKEMVENSQKDMQKKMRYMDTEKLRKIAQHGKKYPKSFAQQELRRRGES